MIVEIVDYGDACEKKFIAYEVKGLSSNQIKYIHFNLNDETSISEDILKIVMYFEPELYPFQSEVAKLKMADFIAREEIEMTVFLSSYLEDM